MAIRANAKGVTRPVPVWQTEMLPVLYNTIVACSLGFCWSKPLPPISYLLGSESRALLQTADSLVPCHFWGEISRETRNVNIVNEHCEYCR